MCGLSITAIAPDDTSAPVTCQVDGCNNMALQRVSMAGWPAGEVCTSCATLFSKVWQRETGEVARVRRRAMLHRAAA